MGVDVVGAIPHDEHTREDGVQSARIACDLAERHDRPPDLQVDETDDSSSRFTEVKASEALGRGIGDRTTAGHTTAMHSSNNAHADKVMSLLVDGGVSVVTNPPDDPVLEEVTTAIRAAGDTPESTSSARRASPSESGTTPFSILGTTTVSRTRWTPRSFSFTTHTWRVAATFRRCGRC